jgi:hypothetical protein
MKHLEVRTQGPTLTRRGAFTAIGVAIVGASVLSSPLEALEGGRGPTNNHGAANGAKQERAPFVLSF